MSEVPTSQESLDVVDDSYKRASALDSSKPSEFARRKVLAHAAQVAAERAVKHGASAQAPRFNAPPPANKTVPSFPRMYVAGKGNRQLASPFTSGIFTRMLR